MASKNDHDVKEKPTCLLIRKKTCKELLRIIYKQYSSNNIRQTIFVKKYSSNNIRKKIYRQIIFGMKKISNLGTMM